MNKYNQIMDEVSVTPELRQRVLDYVLSRYGEDNTYKKKNPRSTHQFVRWASVIAACFVILTAGIHIYQNTQPSEPGVPPDLTIGNVEEYTSLVALEAAVGFSVPQIQVLPFDVTETLYTNVFGVARVSYNGANQEELIFSKGVDDKSDLSGDNNEYETVTEEEIDGCTVTMKGNDNTISLALWVKDEYAYAISVSPGLDTDVAKKIILTIMAQ